MKFYFLEVAFIHNNNNNINTKLYTKLFPTCEYSCLFQYHEAFDNSGPIAVQLLDQYKIAHGILCVFHSLYYVV